MAIEHAPVTQEQVTDRLTPHSETLRRLGVKSLAIFGSVARGEADSASDIDLLVEFDGATTYDAYMDVKFLIEDALGRQVDLVVKRAIKPRRLPAIERDAVLVLA